MQPRKLISVWKPPRRKTILRRSLPGGSDIMIIRAFHHSGWTKVIIGITLYCQECSETNFGVEKIHVGSLELMSIIGINVTEDWPGWLPRWESCIKSRGFAVRSWAILITMLLMLISTAWLTKPWCCIWMHPFVKISCGLTFFLGTGWLCFVPGVTEAMIPMQWNIYCRPRFLCCGQHYLQHIEQTQKCGWVYHFLDPQWHFAQISALLDRHSRIHGGEGSW